MKLPMFKLQSLGDITNIVTVCQIVACLYEVWYHGITLGLYAASVGWALALCYIIMQYRGQQALDQANRTNSLLTANLKMVTSVMSIASETLDRQRIKIAELEEGQS